MKTLFKIPSRVKTLKRFDLKKPIKIKVTREELNNHDEIVTYHSGKEIRIVIEG